LEVCPTSYIAYIDAVVLSDDARETEVVILSDASVELIRDCAIKVALERWCDEEG
jgi:hypothetical protein